MRRILPLIFILVLLWTGYAVAGAFLREFKARSVDGNVELEWSTGEEKDLIRFEVQRQAGLRGDYVKIGEVAPKGSNSTYRFVDKSAYKVNDSLYKYRLAIVSTDGTTYSRELTVLHSVSGVKRTWGSIKAMFR